MRIDPRVFRPESVPAGTPGGTHPPPRGGGAATEPPSDLAVERLIPGPAGPLRLRVLRSGEVRACYLHVHGGGWALGGPDRHDETLLRFARAARVAVVAVE